VDKNASFPKFIVGTLARYSGKVGKNKQS